MTRRWAVMFHLVCLKTLAATITDRVLNTALLRRELLLSAGQHLSEAHSRWLSPS